MRGLHEGGLNALEVAHQAQWAQHTQDTEGRDIHQTDVHVVYPASGHDEEVKRVEVLLGRRRPGRGEGMGKAGQRAGRGPVGGALALK